MCMIQEFIAFVHVNFDKPVSQKKEKFRLTCFTVNSINFDF